MRHLLYFLLVTPFLTAAQINRSANQVAQEAAKEYIVKKIFNDKNYKSVWFSDLRERVNKKDGTSWVLEHRFNISDKESSNFEKGEPVTKEYSFFFFLDKRMHILRAESYTVKE